MRLLAISPPGPSTDSGGKRKKKKPSHPLCRKQYFWTVHEDNQDQWQFETDKMKSGLNILFYTKSTNLDMVDRDIFSAAWQTPKNISWGFLFLALRWINQEGWDG
jgi:hypothetical protein